MIFLGSCSGDFYAVDASTGRVRWSYDVKQDGNQSSFHGNPVLTTDLVVIGVDRGTDPQGQGHVYAFERATGRVRWKHLAAPGVSSDILTDGSLIITLAQTGELIGLDIHSGQLVWKKKVTDAGRDRYLPSPALLNHVVYAGGYMGTLTAVNAQTGAPLWQRSLESDIRLQPVIAGDGLYVVTDTHIYKVATSSGRVLDNVSLDATPIFQPVAMANSIVLEFQDHTVRSLSTAEKMKTSWSQKAAADLTTHGPFFVGGDVVVADATNQLMAFKLSDGALDWTFKFADLKAPITVIASEQNHLYVGTQGGTLSMLELEPPSKPLPAPVPAPISRGPSRPRYNQRSGKVQPARLIADR